jgi:Uma2 family endonuclease
MIGGLPPNAREWPHARNAVPEYWLANLVHGVLEVHRIPQGSEYLEHHILRKGKALVPNGASRAVAVADLLP